MNRTVTAILLAAGKSRRMGCCKQLLPAGDSTLIGRCIATLLQGGVDDIVAVVAKDNHETVSAAQLLPVRVAVNNEENGDMASSIRTGRDCLDAMFSGVIVALSDYPLVVPATVATLIDRHVAFPDRIISPAYRERRGHPVLFPRFVLDRLHAGMTLRDVMRIESECLYDIPVNDPGILMDVDTPHEYQNMLRHLESHDTHIHDPLLFAH